MEDKNKSKLDKVLEGFKPIPMKRLFYPRGMKLSEEFINAFHREYDRLVGEGLNPKTLVERVGKAMKFHINDPRKYKLLDEEQDQLDEKHKKGHKEDHRGHGHDCEDVHKDQSHDEWKKEHKPKASKAHKRKHK